MKTARFEVLSREEVERIHTASMEVLATVGVKVEWKTAREIFREAGAQIDDEGQCVRIPEDLVRWAVDQAPEQFILYGSGPADVPA
jgi:trimethylamine--corrinoid protein Co-methyltransferase